MKLKRTCKLLISTPSDIKVDREIKTVKKVIADFNKNQGEDWQLVLETVFWKDDAHPELGDSPQNILNYQIVDTCFGVIAMFWTRLGTPTDKHESGTVEEITRIKKEGKPVFLFFSDCPIPPSEIDLDQIKRVKEFKKSCRTEGLYFSYKSLEEFGDILKRGLVKYFRNFKTQLLQDQEAREKSPAIDLRQEEEDFVVEYSKEENTLWFYGSLESHDPDAGFGGFFMECAVLVGKNDNPKLTLDIRELNYMSSAGIGPFIRFFNLLQTYPRVKMIIIIYAYNSNWQYYTFYPLSKIFPQKFDFELISG